MPGSEYDTVVNVQKLRRVWNMSEKRLSLPENCLNIPQYTLMSLNMSEHRSALPNVPEFS